MNSKEFMELMMTENGKKAQKLFEDEGSELTIFSCRHWVIEKATTEGIDTELLELVNKANGLEIDIEDVERKERAKQKTVNKFFDSIEKSDKRLFLLLGESGVGKSYSIAKRFPNAITYACNKGLDPHSLLFSMEEGQNGELTTKETPFNQALQNAEMVVFNEINELPHETLMFLQGITDETESVVVGSHYIKIRKGFKVVGTMNPPSETDERTPLGDALMKRAIGYVMRITDDITCQRIGCPKEFLHATRDFYQTISKNELFVDMRRLTFRDYQSLWEFDFENQMEYLCCMGDIQNILAYQEIKETGEYEQQLKDVEDIKNGKKHSR